MRSPLSPNVYRRLPAGHGLLRRCSISGALPSLCARANANPHPFRVMPAPPPRRSIFGVFQKPPRQPKAPEFEPGYDTLVKFRSMQIDGLRLPPRQELLDGFATFFAAKKKTGKLVNATQAFLAMELLGYLLETAPPDGQNTSALPEADTLRQALQVLAQHVGKKTGDHEDQVILARALFIAFQRQAPREAENGQGTLNHKDSFLYAKVLSRLGATSEAAGLFRWTWDLAPPEEKWRTVPLDSDHCESSGKKKARFHWSHWYRILLQGFASENKAEELVRTIHEFEAIGFEYGRPVQLAVTVFFASRDKVEETKYWFGRSQETALPLLYHELLGFARRNDQRDWIRPLFEDLVNSVPPREYWGVILKWAVLVMDKGVEDVKKMLKLLMEMERDNGPGTVERQEKDYRQMEDGERPEEDHMIGTIEALLEAAIEARNPYLAERFLALGQELGLQSRRQTYLLLLEYRLEARDFAGAHEAYMRIRDQEPGPRDPSSPLHVHYNDDLPILNKYLIALCTREDADMELVLEIIGDIERRAATLEPEAVVALCMSFLKHDLQYDVIDTLSIHTAAYSIQERAQIRNAFVEYCTDRSNSTARVWDAYSLLRQFFPETERELRVRLMHEFFGRKRADMACYVFGHMRAHTDDLLRPTAETYVQCLEALGHVRDEESLKMVHNMLKMDARVHMNVTLYNALMIAYRANGQASRAVEFWKDIENSDEGPSYNSLTIFFWACENIGTGAREAIAVWQKLQQMDLDIPQDVYHAYCCALARHGYLDAVKRLIKGMSESHAYTPNFMTFGATYNALPMAARGHYMDWASREYPDEWSVLESKGRRTGTMDGDRFNITRTFKA